MKGKYEKNDKKKFQKIIEILLIMVLLSVFIYSSYEIIYWLRSNKKLEKLEKEVYSKVVKDIVDEEDGTVTKVVDFEALKDINEDVIAWIIIDNTNINYPILQTNNNEYYLYKDLYKSNSSCGSIFLDCNTKSDFSEQNNVLYGHHLQAGGMFTDLDKIYNGELGESVYIRIYTKDGLNLYKVISSYRTKQDLNIVRKSFSDKNKKIYIENAIKRSNVKFAQDVDYNNNLITLITCFGKQRTVVNALKD